MSDDAIDLLVRRGLRLAAAPLSAGEPCETALPFALDDDAAPFGHGPGQAFTAILDALDALAVRLDRLECALAALPPPPDPERALAGPFAALTARLAAIEATLAVVAAAPPPPDPAAAVEASFAALSGRMDALAAAVAAPPPPERKRPGKKRAK
ncbi:MAG: hypothetical protein IPG47_13210 [Thermoflexaceae bacterium]|nr:hypothetical protein [Thermoflexaceae bacterium]